MRIVGRSVFALLILLTIYGVYQTSWQFPAWLTGSFVSDTLIEKARPTTVYLLDKKQWTEFIITTQGERLKLLSHAGITKSAKNEHNKVWTYALEYQLIDDSGEIIEHRTYHHRAKLVLYQDDLTDHTLRHRYFYLEDDITPINAATFTINTSKSIAPLRLRLRLVEAMEDIIDVGVRVYQPDPIPQDRMGVTWTRLSHPQRERLARGMIYEPEQLREHEIQGLLLNRFAPLGPQGVRDIDYQDRTLYILTLEDESWQEFQADSIRPNGIYTDDWIRGIITTPEQGARAKIQFIALDRIPARNEKIILRWYGRNLYQHQEEILSVDHPEFTLERHYQGGMVEIITEHPFVIQAENAQQDDPDAFYAGRFHLRSFTSEQTNLEYHIDHLNNYATPFRVDLRILEPDHSLQGTHTAQYVHYEFADQTGKTLRKGQLAVNTDWSHYDHHSHDQDHNRISEAARYYFALPKNVHSVRFFSDAPVYVNTYTRPADLPRKLYLPEHRYPNTQRDSVHPAWFLLRPTHVNKRIAADQSTVLVIQSRPPKRNPALLAGQYRLHNLYPQGDWLSRYIIQPRETGAVVRDTGRASVFRTLSTNQSQQLNIKSAPGVPSVAPRLIYIRDNANSANFSIKLDSTVILNAEIVNKVGELTLPRLKTGVHSLTLESPEDIQWLINYSGSGEKSFLKRMVYRLPSQGLTFEYHKQLDEVVLSAQLFLSASQDERARLAVFIEDATRSKTFRSPGPYHHWTFLHYIHDVKPDQANLLTVLHARGEQVGDGQRFFIPLGSDLPNGKYLIHFHPLADFESYLSLYQLELGTFDLRYFFADKVSHPHAEI